MICSDDRQKRFPARRTVPTDRDVGAHIDAGPLHSCRGSHGVEGGRVARKGAQHRGVSQGNDCSTVPDSALWFWVFQKTPSAAGRASFRHRDHHEGLLLSRLDMKALS